MPTSTPAGAGATESAGAAEQADAARRGRSSRLRADAGEPEPEVHPEPEPELEEEPEPAQPTAIRVLASAVEAMRWAFGGVLPPVDDRGFVTMSLLPGDAQHHH